MSTLSQFYSSGGLQPPTTLTAVSFTGGASITATVVTKMAASVSATVTSASLTTVLDISGSGVFTFLQMLNAAGGGAVSPAALKITIDGVVALDESALSFASDPTCYAVVGVFADESAGASTESSVVFNSSFKVEIAGDGTDGVILAYKRYLT